MVFIVPITLIGSLTYEKNHIFTGFLVLSFYNDGKYGTNFDIKRFI